MHCRYMLFPCLRATADLLMMPKEVLTDRAIRAEVVPGLSPAAHLPAAQPLPARRLCPGPPASRWGPQPSHLLASHAHIRQHERHVTDPTAQTVGSNMCES